MIGPTRKRVLITIATAALCLTLAALGVPAAFGASPQAYKRESLQVYEQQLATGQIKSVVINKRLRSVRVTLKSGELVKAEYPPHEEPNVAAALRAKRVPVVVLTPAEAKKEASKATVHHKLRYIAGGILIAVVVIVGAVLLWDRRRKRLAE
jgi:hypothetical protein